MFIQQSHLPRTVEQISPGRGQSESIDRLAQPVAVDATVLKTYKPNAAPNRQQAEELLQAGIRLKRQYPSAYARIAWPRAFVTTKRGGIVGAAMPMAPEEVFYRDRGARRPCPVELLCLPGSRPVRQAGLITPQFGLRLNFCLGIAAITNRIHQVGGLYCDFSQSNILWTCDPNQDTVCMPYFLDADGIVIGTERKDIYTANWKDEYPRPDGLADTATDVYKVALLTFRALNLTFRLPPPGQYRLDTSLMPAQVIADLQPTVDAALGPRAGRPTMEEFHTGLRDARALGDRLLPAKAKPVSSSSSASIPRVRAPSAPKASAPGNTRPATPVTRPRVRSAPPTGGSSTRLGEQTDRLRQWIEDLAPSAIHGFAALLLATVLIGAIVRLT